MKKYMENMSKQEISKAEKLNKLTNPKTFWDDVRKFTAKVYSDRALSQWQYLAEIRYNELITGVEDVREEYEEDDECGNYLEKHYYTYDWKNRVYPKEV